MHKVWYVARSRAARVYIGGVLTLEKVIRWNIPPVMLGMSKTHMGHTVAVISVSAGHAAAERETPS